MSCNYSDVVENAPANYIFIIEGGNQNRVIRKDMAIVDSGLVDYRYNDEYIIFSIDTTFSSKNKMIPKDDLLYYIHDIKKDTLFRELDIIRIKEIIKNKSIRELDITDKEE